MFTAILVAILIFGPSGDTLDEDLLALTEEMKAYFEERVDRRAPPRVRVELILSALFDSDGLDFSYRNVTRSAAATFQHSSGDCLSFTNLFVAVARHFKLTTRYREVDVAPNWGQRGSIVVFNRHVNSVVGAGSQGYVIDLIPQINRIEIAGRIVTDERGFAHFYNNKGAEALADGSLVLAARYFEKALEFAPEASFIWANYGVIQAHQEKVEEAEQSYRRAIELDRHDMVALTNLARLFENQGRQEEASLLQERIEDFRNRNPYYHYSLGEESYSAGKYDLALEHYEDALRRKSKEPLFYHSLAKAYAQLGNIPEAVKYLKKARKYSPDEAGRSRYSQKLAVLGVKQDDF